MYLTDLVALTLAAGGLVDCWLNGSIFARPRRALARWPLFGCDYCLNWQAPFWLVLLFYAPAPWLPYPWDKVLRLPVYALAAAYAAWLVNEARARRECDYDRTRRGERDREQYGGGQPGPDGPPGPAPRDETHDHTPSRRVPALFPADGSEADYFCTAACQAHAALVADGNDEKYTMGVGTVAPGARCGYCGQPLL